MKVVERFPFRVIFKEGSAGECDTCILYRVKLNRARAQHVNYVSQTRWTLMLKHTQAHPEYILDNSSFTCLCS